jgi:two-component system LytT family response regulator
MIKTILVDDEARSRKTLEMLLQQHFPEIEVVGQGENVKSGLEKITTLEPQLVFLDIEMPDGSGFDLLRKVEDYNFEVIFTTAFDEYALEAFRFSAIGYLQKPVSAKEFQQTVQKAIELIKLRQGSREGQINALLENYNNPSGKMHKLILPDTEGFHVIPIADIVYLEGDRNYSKIFLTNKESLFSSYNLGWYEKFLDKGFYRISRSHIINIAHVTRFSKQDGGSVSMINDVQLHISAGKKEELRKLFL